MTSCADSGESASALRRPTRLFAKMDTLESSCTHVSGIDLESLEAPPGFEPGMEVLQTSALPLGDGAGRNRLYEGSSGRELEAATTARRRADRYHRFSISPVRLRATRFGGTTFAFALRARRKLERETGFEPATSTLARSHSTTELFPLATN